MGGEKFVDISLVISGVFGCLFVSLLSFIVGIGYNVFFHEFKINETFSIKNLHQATVPNSASICINSVIVAILRITDPWWQWLLTISLLIVCYIALFFYKKRYPI